MPREKSQRCCSSAMRRIKIAINKTIKQKGKPTIYKKDWKSIGWVCLCCKRVMHTNSIKGDKTHSVYIQDGVKKTWKVIGSYNLSKQEIIIKELSKW